MDDRHFGIALYSPHGPLVQMDYTIPYTEQMAPVFFHEHLLMLYNESTHRSRREFIHALCMTNVLCILAIVCYVHVLLLFFNMHHNEIMPLVFN